MSLDKPSSKGHVLAERLIEKHGVDRYPNLETKLLKLVEEVGELVATLTKHKGVDAFSKEFADVGFTLYHIGNSVSLDLIEEMEKVLENETRRFVE